MKEFFKNIARDKTARFGFITSFILYIITFIFILASFNNLPPFIPIFNQLPWGEQRLGTTAAIFIPILADLLIIISNLVIAAVMYQKTPLLSRMLAVTTVVTTILVCLFTIKTVKLVY